MKTYKRELAVVLLLWLAYVVEVKEPNVVEVLVWPVFTFAALSFGLDWFGKSPSSLQQSTPKSTNRRGTERSSQRTGSANSNSDSGYDTDHGTEDK